MKNYWNISSKFTTTKIERKLPMNLKIYPETMERNLTTTTMTTSQPISANDSPKRLKSKTPHHWNPSQRQWNRQRRPKFSSAINAMHRCQTLNSFGFIWKAIWRKITAHEVSAAAQNISIWIMHSITLRRNSFVSSAEMWCLIIASSMISIWKNISLSTFAANVTTPSPKTTICKTICLRITSALNVRSATRVSSRLCHWSCTLHRDIPTKGVRRATKISDPIETSRIMCMQNIIRRIWSDAFFVVLHARRNLKCIFISYRHMLSNLGELIGLDFIEILLRISINSTHINPQYLQVLELLLSKVPRMFRVISRWIPSRSASSNASRGEWIAT